MLGMVSYPRRPLSGHITCYLNRTYHVLPTQAAEQPGGQAELQVPCAGGGHRNSVIRIHGVAIVDCGDLAQIEVHAQVWRKHRRQRGGSQLSSGFEGWEQVDGD